MIFQENFSTIIDTIWRINSIKFILLQSKVKHLSSSSNWGTRLKNLSRVRFPFSIQAEFCGLARNNWMERARRCSWNELIDGIFISLFSAVNPKFSQLLKRAVYLKHSYRSKVKRLLLHLLSKWSTRRIRCPPPPVEHPINGPLIP